MHRRHAIRVPLFALLGALTTAAGPLVATAGDPPTPWAPVTHLHLAEIALIDALDDGRITVCLVDGEDIVGTVGSYAVSNAILSALRAAPSHFRAGVLGPDAYPDIATGQRVIHPRVSGPSPTPWRAGLTRTTTWSDSADGTDAWLSYLWRDAFMEGSDSPWRGDEAVAWRAFVVGYLIHAAGDMFGHTYVNYFTGGPFELGENAAKHITIERMVGKRTPRPPDGVLRHHADLIWDPLYARLVRADPNTTLDHDLLVGRDAVLTSVPRIFSDIRNRLVAEIQAYANSDDPTYKLANAAADEYRRSWVADIDRGLRAWPQISHEISKGLFFGDDYPDVSISDVASHYTNRYLLSMLGFPDEVGDTRAELGALQDAMIPDDVQAEVDAMREDLLAWLFETATGMSWEEFEDPETFFDDVVGQGGGRHISLADFDGFELGFDRVTSPLPGGGGSCAGPAPRAPTTGFDYRAFPPAYNTVVMTQLALLDRSEANRLLRDLGGRARLSAPNVMLGFITSLDESNQWLDGVQMAFARERDVFRQIFMTQRGEEDARGVIAGTVTADTTGEPGERGEPLANVLAEVYEQGPSGEERRVRSGVTDAEGRYEVGWLEEGPHHVYFRAFHIGYTSEWWDDAEELQRTPVQVSGDVPADTIDAALALRRDSITVSEPEPPAEEPEPPPGPELPTDPEDDVDPGSCTCGPSVPRPGRWSWSYATTDHPLAPNFIPTQRPQAGTMDLVVLECGMAIEIEDKENNAPVWRLDRHADGSYQVSTMGIHYTLSGVPDPGTGRLDAQDEMTGLEDGPWGRNQSFLEYLGGSGSDGGCVRVP